MDAAEGGGKPKTKAKTESKAKVKTKAGSTTVPRGDTETVADEAVAPPATAATDDPTLVTAAPAVGGDAGPSDAPPAARQQRRRPRPAGEERPTPGPRRGRRVRRVIRRIDLWSVLKLAIVLYTCLYVAVMVTLALLWGLAYSSGQIEKVQSFMADVGMDNYRFYGDQMWRACAMIGAVGVLAATIITVLTAALVNVISEMTGGIRVVVIEEDVPPRRRNPAPPEPR
ncbi:MAG: hypothetical protein GX643_15615 [Acidimicrobiales bacterium]|nr:hypothetical protein [Acidimicrobiales bacterium]